MNAGEIAIGSTRQGDQSGSSDKVVVVAIGEGGGVSNDTTRPTMRHAPVLMLPPALRAPLRMNDTKLAVVPGGSGGSVPVGGWPTQMLRNTSMVCWKPKTVKSAEGASGSSSVGVCMQCRQWSYGSTQNAANTKGSK